MGDELPEWDPRKPQPQADIDDPELMKDPEALLQATKKGKTIMVFVKVKGNPTKQEAETITSIWQTGLWNSHIHCDRYPLDDNRFIFMFKDGSIAWEAKDFLIEQEECLEVTVEQKTYHGKYTEAYKKEQEEASKAKVTKDKKKKPKKKKSKSKKDEL